MKLIEKLRRKPLDVAAAALIVLVGAVLPWGRSGRADRSSFELVRLARRLDVLEGVTATVAKLWLATPLVVAVIVVGATLGWRRLAVTLGTALAAAGVGLVIAVHESPLIPRYGLSVTMVGATVMVVAGVLRVGFLARDRWIRTGDEANR